MAEGRITKKKLAHITGVSEKTLRNTEKRTAALEQIEVKLSDPEKYERLSDLINSKASNKKECISSAQIQSLCQLDDATLSSVVDKVLLYPDNAKDIIGRYAMTTVKTTISLDGIINEWFRDQAEMKGISKADYIRQILTDFYSEHENE